MTDAHAVTRYPCPLPDCGWYHDEPLPDVPEGASEQDLHDLAALSSDADKVLGEHFAGHSLMQWVSAVSTLRQQLAAQPQALACLACVVARHNAQRAGVPQDELPGIAPAAVIANGNGICKGHLQITDGPALPDRTAGGIVLPNGHVNGSSN